MSARATCYNFFLLRYRPGTDLRAAAARLEAAVTRAHCPTGLPLGVVAGRWAWALFAASAGAGGNADIPVPIVLATIPATLLLANAIAAGPGWAAARIRPSVVLRSE